MRKFKLSFRITLTLLASLLTIYVTAQNDLPDIKIKNLNGQEVSFKGLSAGGDTAVVVNLWATWCVPCVEELESINDQYADRQKETPFKIIAVSIDDARTSGRVRSFVKGKGWKFDIYLDPNSDLKRALNVNEVPHVLIIKNGKIVYQHNGYLPGNEEELFEKLKTI